jgi:hypothetical protein
MVVSLAAVFVLLVLGTVFGAVVGVALSLLLEACWRLGSYFTPPPQRERPTTTGELRRLLGAPGDGACLTRFTGEGGICQ